jgi:hypothetical protein
MKKGSGSKSSIAASRQKLKQLSSSSASKEKLKQNLKLLLKTHPQYGSAIKRALKLETSECNDNTQISQWLGSQLSDWDVDVIMYVLGLDMLNLPTYDALVFENSPAKQYYGKNGEYTQRLTKTLKDLKRFWNIESQNIVMVGMHGNMLADRTKLVRTYEAAYGLSNADAQFYADFVLAVLDAFPQLRNGEHPIFTFNAFALPGFNFHPYGIIPDKIVMGDGILEAFTAVGYGDVAPQAILAHEFGHHIQFELNLFTDEDTPEATRRTELMADAYAAYYLSHARGASMQWKRVKQFLQVFFNIGDCSFESSGHHGTPTQRMAAAEWAYNLANSAQKQGHILTAQEFTKLFEAALPGIINQ